MTGIYDTSKMLLLNDELEWITMQQKVKHQRRGIVTMYVPNEMTTCYKPCSASTTITYDGTCCTSSFKCGVDEGDCDYHSDCQDGLQCGTDNCPSGYNFPSDADCCYVP